MSDLMTFPATVEEFMEQYKTVDSEHMYSNGIEYVPIFRMNQWFEHMKRSDGDTIRRQAAIEALEANVEALDARIQECLEKQMPASRAAFKTCKKQVLDDIATIKALPPVPEPPRKVIATIKMSEEDVKKAFNKAVMQIMAAQGKIIRCKDCRFRDPEDKRCDNGAQWCGFPKNDDDFCSYAERRGRTE